MANSALGSDTMPKAGRVNEVCKEWLVLEDGALAYRLQDEEIKDHYTGNKVRNAQVREDAPKARIEQEYEKLKYLSGVQEQEERDALIARQIALNLEREERMKERELREQMRLQLRLDDEAAQSEIEREYERKLQEEKDQILARKLQEEEEQLSVDLGDRPRSDDQTYLDHKIALEAQDAEFARVLQEKEKIRAKRAREKARQRKLERQQQSQHQHQSSQDSNDAMSSLERSQRPQKSESKHSSSSLEKSRRSRNSGHRNSLHSDPEEIKPCDEPDEDESDAAPEPLTPQKNVAAMIDPTYNGQSSSPGFGKSVESPIEDFVPCIIPGQRRSSSGLQSPSQSVEEKHKRRVKDGCKQQ